MNDTHTDSTMIRFRVDSDDIALLFPSRSSRADQRTLDPDRPWVLAREGQGPHNVTEAFFRGQSWTDPIPLREVAALMHTDDRSPVRQLAHKLLGYSIGNSQPHKDIQRQGYVDIRFALGDHPTDVYDDLAASRVIDVTPTESALDGADVVLAAVRGLAQHEGLSDTRPDGLVLSDHELMREAEQILVALHDRLQTRAARAEEERGRARGEVAYGGGKVLMPTPEGGHAELDADSIRALLGYVEQRDAEECPNCSDPFHEGSLVCRRCGCIRPLSSKVWAKEER